MAFVDNDNMITYGPDLGKDMGTDQIRYDPSPSFLISARISMICFGSSPTVGSVENNNIRISDQSLSDSDSLLISFGEGF